MNVQFDGPNKLVICNYGTTHLSVQDTYSYWKEWSLVSDNAKYKEAFSVLGGDPTVAGKFLGSTYFLENGWKIRPYEGNHVLVIEGNLYARTGGVLVPTVGAYNVQVQQIISNIIDTVSTGGGSSIDVDAIVDGVFRGIIGTYKNEEGSFGKAIYEMIQREAGNLEIDREAGTIKVKEPDGTLLYTLTMATVGSIDTLLRS
jgi:hypothetical protein